MSRPSEAFRPPARLRNAHVQSIYPSLPTRRPGVERRCRALITHAREVVLDCGEGVRLLACETTQERLGRPAARRVVVVLHGWEGSAQALYTLSLGQYLLDNGFDVVRLNLRDHGGSHALNEGLFHSCRIAEVVGAVRRVQELHPACALYLCGFSLGGNFALRVAARARAAGIEIEGLVAICPPLDPARTLARLESGWWVYHRYFVWKWRQSLRQKQAAWPHAYDLGDILHLDSLTAMTDVLVRRFTGFPSLADYLQGYAITGDRLTGLASPARIIAAADDPIIPADDLDRLAPSPQLTVTCSRFGGHCGFYEGGRGPTWLEREVLATFDARR
ncbi:MAG TPA: alpha/beta fold hydrolase [Steroidobacteraceae bacterium]|nr:alpha/beta fold hydrolase [Steroidobacteraceae bacterium]